MTPDVNVLVAAMRSDHSHYAPASAWLKAAVADAANGGTLEILPMVAAGYVRLVTNPRIFPQPTPTDAAFKHLSTLLAIPGASMPLLGGEWPVMERLCVSEKLSGLVISDAWIAAAVIVNGLHLASFDRDFARLLPRGQFTLLKP